MQTGGQDFFFFFKKNTKKNPAPALEACLQRLSNPQTFNQLQKAEMDYSLSVWVFWGFFLEIGINAQLTAHQLKLPVYSTLTGREQ